MPVKLAHLQLDRPDVVSHWCVLNRRFTVLWCRRQQVRDGSLKMPPLVVCQLEREYFEVLGALTRLLPSVEER